MISEKLQIKISNDKMSAKLLQNTALEDGEIITSQDVMSLLNEHGIVYGIKEDVINDIVQTLENGLTEAVLIAEGKKPVSGKDAYLKPVDFNNKDKKGPSNDTLNAVDLKDVIQIPSVNQGDFIGEKIPATDGEKGTNILGEEVPCKVGRDFVLRPGKNTSQSQDGLQLFAQIDGQMSVDKKTIHVYPIYEINGDVNMRVGNIDFVGNVLIRGSVPNGFEIKSKGDIRVMGTVEGAFLQSGGSIYVSAGIVGQGSGKIEAKNDLHTTFINQANIEVEGDIHVTQSILHSDCTAGGSIYCNKGKGNIVGGNISAVKDIVVKDVGNTMNTPTNMFIGVNRGVLEKQTQLTADIKKSNEEIEKLHKLLDVFELKEKNGIPLAPNERVMKLRVRNTLQEMETRILEYKEELSEINNNDDDAAGSIVVEGYLYPNTSITFGKYRRKIASNYQYVKASIQDGEIKITSL